MKISISLFLIVTAFLLVVGPYVGANGPKVGKPAIMKQSDDFDPLARRTSTAAGTATDFDYTTDFEAPNFVARDGTCMQDAVGCTPFTGECGWIGGQDPGPYPRPWAVGSGNQGVGLIEPHVDIVNPFSGQQHLRFSKDLCDTTNAFSFATDARIPGSPTLPGIIGPSTYQARIATDALFGANLNFQPQSGSQGLLTSRTLFFFYGVFYILDDLPGLTFVPVFTYWDYTGTYQEYRVEHNPCDGYICINNGFGFPPNPGAPCVDDSGCRLCDGGASDGLPCLGQFQCPDGTCAGGDCVGRIDYYYGGELIYTGTQFAGTSSEQFLIYTDNFPGDWDVDDVVVITGDPCPTECGNLIVETGEQCDGINDDNCPGRCVPPDAVGPAGEAECNCVIIGEVPTELPNGTTNVISHGGWWTFVADAPAYAVDTCGSTGYDSALAAYTGTVDSLALISVNDDCDVNSPYSYGTADPLASCHPVSAPWESCLCIPTTIGQRYWIQDLRATLGGTTNITLSKRLDCGAIWETGACCDRVDGTCADEVAEVGCQGAEFEFTLAKFCASEAVVCEPAGGACCNRSPGAGGACADGVFFADCQAPQEIWTLDAVCADVACDEARGACCDGFTGSCSITLAGDCVGFNQVWTKESSCSEVACEAVPGACCQYEEVRRDVVEVSCTDALTQSQCADLGDTAWHKGASCAEVECGFPIDRIPTVSEWGMLVLALALLIAAKVWFSRRSACA